MSHTKEPWRTTELDRVIADCMEKVNDDYFIADCFGPDAKANARRIVACVNACAGVSTEYLEGFAVGVNATGIPIDKVMELSNNERDTYRDLCADLVSIIKLHVNYVDEAIHCDFKEAITKAE